MTESFATTPVSRDPDALSPGSNELSHAESAVSAGEMRARIEAFDWSRTPLGPIEGWPQSLRTAVDICLTSRSPILLWWGPELVELYNDAYRPVLGATKHPQALGAPGKEIWPEIWPVIGPLLESVIARGESTWQENQFLILDRNGYDEETYFTYGYSPIRDESGGIGGVFSSVLEQTERVLGERRFRALRELAAIAADGKSAQHACELAARVLAEHRADVPFALLYLVDPDGRSARLVAASGLPVSSAASPSVITVAGATAAETDSATVWPLAHVAASRRAEVVIDVTARVGSLPPGPWPVPPTSAIVLPLAQSGQDTVAGFFVAGINPRRALDDAYRGFLDLAAGHITAAVANARAFEEQKQRAEALAELDRAKTQFFSNVSHEFRTPLTLMLGPAEDALGDPSISDTIRERVDLIHRNALRLLKLVNTLLDVSRIEAGRVDAAYVPTDLPALTYELASTFRSAIERAGLALVLDCPPLGTRADAVFVDRDMWEKVVLNLLSNAFKHTFDGEIAVALRLADDGRHIVLTVRDTGIGIAPDQLPYLFERFHRVPNARSRTHEGTGIGLALVQELVRLHGGTIEVTSREGVGTTFTVRIPVGAAHLSPDQVRGDGHLPPRRASTALDAAVYTAEALRWLPTESSDGTEPAQPRERPMSRAAVDGGAMPARVLLADDNADLREYVARLLRSRGWTVEVVADGAAALDAARQEPPDLVLSDVMMPGLDGFELLRALRAHPRTQTVPVILLSARAGEEARIEGLDAGADDYLIKPFSARELLARVGAHIGLAQTRARATAAVAAARAELEMANDQLQEQAAELEATNEQLQDQAAELEARRAELESTTEELAQQSEEREQLLEAERSARAAAEAANRSKAEFLAAMSHELRTPLNAIAGHAQLLEMEIHGAVTTAQREALARIQRSEQHLLALINDVLNFAKLEAGRVEFEIERVRLADLVSEVLRIVEPQVVAKGLTTAMHVPSDVAARADRDKVRQILLNLLSNAIKFTESGGQVVVNGSGSDGGKSQQPELAPPDASGRDVVILRVSDTGCGIPREKQDIIFDPFVQVHRDLTRPTGGTGLGLAISRDLARRMGGDVRVRSTEGEGSTFTLTLPRA